MIQFDFNKHCCGCAACVDACKKHCISIKDNREGFRVPQIDKSKCVSCGRCEKVCPVLNVNVKENEEQKCYCTYHLDAKVRNAGSSGSMFYLIADYIINKNGVVFGAAFDEQLQLRHTMAKKQDELWPLMKSKYLQSNTTGVFEQVRMVLQEGKQALFVGTPCQCQALYNYINVKQRENLILVDFICHGVPSQDLFNRYIRSYEKKKKAIVKSFVFREKKTPKPPKNEDDIHNYTMEIYDKNEGRTSIETGFYRDCSFYSGFKKYQIFRNSCYECKFIGRNRITDFTLGDFWHLTEYESGIEDFHKGYSEFIVNSERGKIIFESLKNQVYCKEFSMEIPLKRNHAYSMPTVKHVDRKLFSLLYFFPYSVLSLIWSRNIVMRGTIRILRKIFG